MFRVSSILRLLDWLPLSLIDLIAGTCLSSPFLECLRSLELDRDLERLFFRLSTSRFLPVPCNVGDVDSIGFARNDINILAIIIIIIISVVVVILVKC